MQSLEDFKARFAVDEAHYLGDMASVLASLQPVCLHLLDGVNSDRSGAAVPCIDNNRTKLAHCCLHMAISV